MRKIIVFTNQTLDGVMQASGQQDEDLRGGFQFCGRGAPYAVMTYANSESMANSGMLLFGKCIYEDLYNYWPKQSDNPNTEILNNTQKNVTCNTLKEPLPWQNSILQYANVIAAPLELKTQPGKDFLVMGRGGLIQTLMEENLLNLYILLTHLNIRGLGRRLFHDNGNFTSLKLLESNTTPNRTMIAS